MAEISDRDQKQIESANSSGRTPAVFIHGLWLLAGSWENWLPVFEEAGYAPIAASWPDDPASVEEAKANPEVFAGKSVAQVADYHAELILGLSKKPVVIGHSFGGLLTEIVVGRGLASASVAISPAPFRGVLPVPLSAVRSSSPVLINPLNYSRSVPLTFEQFRYAFANAVGEFEAKELYEKYSVAGPGLPIFEAVSANLNPWSGLKVDTKNPDRGPLLLVGGERDHTVPWAITHASYKKQRANPGVTEVNEMKGRGHSLTIDSGWREVADTALAFLARFQT